MDDKRTFNTPHRIKWNTPIAQILKAIDNHTEEYLKTGDSWHSNQAQILRTYIHELKTWIHSNEQSK